MGLCLEHKLYAPLIYLSICGEDKDFITPIVKMFAEYRQRMDAPEGNKLGLTCLWYLRMCVRGILFRPEQRMDA